MVFMDRVVAMKHVYAIPRLQKISKKSRKDQERKDTHGIFRENSDSLILSQHDNILESSSFVWCYKGPPFGSATIALLARNNLEVDKVNMNRV